MTYAAALFLSALVAGNSPVALRTGCDPADPVVATVEPGANANILMAQSSPSGKCYKIAVGDHRGYVPAGALSETELFDIGVRSAPVLTATPSSPKTGAPVTAPAPSAANPLVQATRLLNDRQPRAALHLLQSGIATAGYDHLVLASVAARAADDPKSAAGYLERALQIRSDRAVEQLLASVRKEIAADQSTERLAAARFLLRYEDGALDADTARAVVGVLEQEYSRIAAELGCRTDERIVTIVQTPQAYRASSETAEWSGGYFDGSRIRIPVANARTLTPAVRETLSHELVHACLASLGPWPSWLHEGLAMKLSGNSSTAAQQQKVRSLVRQGILPRLGNVSQTWTRMSADAARNAYLYSLVAAEELYDLQQATGISALLRNPELLPRLSAELDKRMMQ